MTGGAGGTAAAAARPQQGRSWKQMVLQVILMQAVFRFFSRNSKKPAAPAADPATGAIVPPLTNAFRPGQAYDLFVFLSEKEDADPFEQSSSDGPAPADLVWAVPDLVYDDAALKEDYRNLYNYTYEMPAKLSHALLEQRVPADLAAEAEGASPPSPLTSPAQLMAKLTGNGRFKRRRELVATFDSVYLIAAAVPHAAYCAPEAPSCAGGLAPHVGTENMALLRSTRSLDAAANSSDAPPMRALRAAASVLRQLASVLSANRDRIVTRSVDLVEYMPPVRGSETGTRSLWKGEEEAEDDGGVALPKTEVPHFKRRIDVRMVVDPAAYHPGTVMKTPHLRRWLDFDMSRGVYSPIVFATDMWLTDEDYTELNRTSLAGGAPSVGNSWKIARFPLDVSFSALSPTWFMVQAQLNEMWNPDERALAAERTGAGAAPGPLALLQAGSQGRRESFMLKRILLRTNRYFLGFSAAFMLLHSVFSFLAFKNDVQFWRRNESMQGLSALSVVSSFVCELVIGLYLYDSEEASFLILFEIFTGIALSAWKVTKALNVAFTLRNGWRPGLTLTDKKGYEQSETKKYDRTAVTWMSLALLPCSLGYSLYCLKTKKYKSWYSFVISSLAGTVYTFGFVMMTPQLYINYKLKSVDHLPWRAFTYKALNTFVDDVAAFIIDMPWMHRLACFRDDVIFLCYLYQRWIYRVDKTRPNEWVAPQPAAEPAADAAAAADAAKAGSSAAAAPDSAETSTVSASAVDGPDTAALRPRKMPPAAEPAAAAAEPAAAVDPAAAKAAGKAE